MTEPLTLVPHEIRDTSAPETAAFESADADAASTSTTVAPRHPDVTPAGITFPRPWEEYRIEAEFADHDRLRGALNQALHDTMLAPHRYAELMWLLDNWFVEDRHEVRQDMVGRRERRC